MEEDKKARSTENIVKSIEKISDSKGLTALGEGLGFGIVVLGMALMIGFIVFGSKWDGIFTLKKNVLKLKILIMKYIKPIIVLVK
jgi:hypothetical protein